MRSPYQRIAAVSQHSEAGSLPIPGVSVVHACNTVSATFRADHNVLKLFHHAAGKCLEGARTAAVAVEKPVCAPVLSAHEVSVLERTKAVIEVLSA